MLAPAQMQRNDMMGAQSMLQSSLTLSKSLHDLPTLLAALQGILQYHEKTGDMANYESDVQYMDKKHAEYVQEVDLAQETHLHSRIMQWQGFS